MTTSIVIPSFNGAKFLTANLPPVLALGADEVIIVDDASTDNSSQVIQSFKQIKLIRNNVNQRFPNTVNTGFKSATGDVVVLLNQDVKPDKDLLKYILPHFKTPEIFAVTLNEQEHSWAKGVLKNGFIEFVNGNLDGKVHPSLWASGGSAAFRKSYWDTMGGFSPEFHPGYYEDFDLGLRAWKRGYHIVWEPKAKVRHTPESTYSRTFPPKYLIRIKERNLILAQWRNLDPENLLPNLNYIFLRAMTHPGYLVPAYMALLKLPRALAFRKTEKKFWLRSDTEVFNLFNS